MKGRSPITPREGLKSLLLGLLVCTILYLIGYIRNPAWAWSNLVGAIPILGVLIFCMLAFILIFWTISLVLFKVEQWKIKQKKNT